MRQGPQANRKLNILHTVRSLRMDGVVKVILRSMARRDEQRFNHYVCALRSESDLADECRALRIEPIILGHEGVLSVPQTVMRLAKLMQHLRIDLVHANRTADLTLAGTAAKLYGIPVVSSLHWLGRLEDHPEEDGNKAWLRRWLEMKATVRLNRALATRIVAVSEAVRVSYSSMPGFPTSRLKVVYPGIDMGSPLPPGTVTGDALKRSLGLEAAQPILLNVGRLHAVKGQRHLIPMMRRICESHPRAKLLIAGEGELRSELQAAIESQGLSHNIDLLGARRDIDALLEVSDLLIVASESESFGLPLLEAMRACRPVVTTNVGGVAELVMEGVNGYIVPRADPAALAAAVLRVVADPVNALRMGAAGRSVAQERFELRRSMAALELLYREVVYEARSGSLRAVKSHHGE